MGNIISAENRNNLLSRAKPGNPASDIIFNSSKSQVMFFDTLKCGHMKNIMLGQNTLHVTKSYTYIGHIITDNLCDEADIKAKVGFIYGRSNILLRKFYFCSERVKNAIFQLLQ